jgi:hypothetical protein
VPDLLSEAEDEVGGRHGDDLTRGVGRCRTIRLAQPPTAVRAGSLRRQRETRLMRVLGMGVD